MPKKKDKKGNDRQGEEKSPKKFNPADKTGYDDKEKDLYLTQIGYLHEQLERYQLKCDELERQSKNGKAQYSILEKEKRGIVEFLKRSLLEKEDEVDGLTERLEGQRQAADKERGYLQLQQDQLRQALQGQIEELTVEKTKLEARLASLEEFQKQKEQLMSNMESLETQLARQEDEHKADIHTLEMKALLEKRRLEAELENHVAAMAQEVQHLVDQKVPDTTRMALQENAELKVQLSQLSEQTRVLMKDNAALQGRRTQLRLDVDILEQTLSEMSRQSCIHKKVVEQLTEKCQQQQDEQKDNRQELKQLQTEHEGIRAEMEALRRDRTSLSGQESRSRAEVQRLEAELQKERKRSGRMKSVLQEAAVTLRQALMEAPSEQEWKKLTHKLLLVLNGASEEQQQQQKQLHHHHHHQQQHQQQSCGPAGDGTGNLDPAASFQFQLARYQVGDLGLVPPPARKHKDRLCRTGAGPCSTATPPLRKPPNRKTAINPKDSQTLK